MLAASNGFSLDELFHYEVTFVLEQVHGEISGKVKHLLCFQVAYVTNISIVHVTLRAQCRLYVSHVMFRLKPHPRQTVAAVVKVCRLWLGRSGVEKCRVDHKIGSKTFMVAELLAKASS